jgi:serine/threonine protein kinase
MALAKGSRLGPYAILSPLGAGGMGEVYRARDTRLGRDVAVKVLPPAFSADHDRLRRFEQEARAAGQLNDATVTAAVRIASRKLEIVWPRASRFSCSVRRFRERQLQNPGFAAETRPTAKRSPNK